MFNISFMHLFHEKKNIFFIVDSMLDALRYVLPKELALQIFSKWYTVSHAPGSNDVTQMQYWTIFASFLLAMMGYNVDNLRMFHYSSLDSSFASEVLAKKFKTSENGSDEVLIFFFN